MRETQYVFLDGIVRAGIGLRRAARTRGIRSGRVRADLGTKAQANAKNAKFDMIIWGRLIPIVVATVNRDYQSNTSCIEWPCNNSSNG